MASDQGKPKPSQMTQETSHGKQTATLADKNGKRRSMQDMRPKKRKERTLQTSPGVRKDSSERVFSKKNWRSQNLRELQEPQS